MDTLVYCDLGPRLFIFGNSKTWLSKTWTFKSPESDHSNVRDERQRNEIHETGQRTAQFVSRPRQIVAGHSERPLPGQRWCWSQRGSPQQRKTWEADRAKRNYLPGKRLFSWLNLLTNRTLKLLENIFYIEIKEEYELLFFISKIFWRRSLRFIWPCFYGFISIYDFVDLAISEDSTSPLFFNLILLLTRAATTVIV